MGRARTPEVAGSLAWGIRDLPRMLLCRCSGTVAYVCPAVPLTNTHYTASASPVKLKSRIIMEGTMTGGRGQRR
jgi:hypothetical protein